VPSPRMPPVFAFIRCGHRQEFAFAETPRVHTGRSARASAGRVTRARVSKAAPASPRQSPSPETDNLCHASNFLVRPKDLPPPYPQSSGGGGGHDGI
jgi:hypothetical protein